MKIQSPRTPVRYDSTTQLVSVSHKYVCISMLVMIWSLINLVFLCKVTWGVIQRS